MNGMTGWVVAAIVIIAAGVFYFWPMISKAPVEQAPAGQSPLGIEESTSVTI